MSPSKLPPTRQVQNFASFHYAKLRTLAGTLGAIVGHPKIKIGAEERRRKMKKLKRKALVFLMMALFSLEAHSSANEFERCIDTFRVEMSNQEFEQKISNWIEKLNGKELPCTDPACDTLPPYYSTGLLRTGLFIRSKEAEENGIDVSLVHVWRKDLKKQALFRIPNVTGTLRQELGIEVQGFQELDKKSYAEFLGLTLINSGIGMAYASSKSPFTYNNVPFTILYGIMDAALTVGLFIDDDFIRTFSAVFLPAAKGAVCIRLIFIKNHNELAKTRYKFRITR